jgi:hypothetical protein
VHEHLVSRNVLESSCTGQRVNQHHTLVPSPFWVMPLEHPHQNIEQQNRFWLKNSKYYLDLGQEISFGPEFVHWMIVVAGKRYSVYWLAWLIGLSGLLLIISLSFHCLSFMFVGDAWKQKAGHLECEKNYSWIPKYWVWVELLLKLIINKEMLNLNSETLI